jgi:uncharacterized integral membrane protein
LQRASVSHAEDPRSTAEVTMSVEPVDTRSPRNDLITPRRVVAVALAAVGLLFILQNRADTSLQLLGFQVTGPQWLASLALLAIGVAIGVLLGTRRPRPLR